MWFWLLLACPSVTDDHQMVGVITHHDGTAVADLSVQSIEARTRTAADGAFTVEYKPPSTYVDFRVGGTQFQRHFREADRDTVVDIRLPTLRETTIICSVPQACTGLLQWDLPDGLIGRVVFRCTPGKVVAATEIPEGEPETTCQTDVTLPNEQVWVHDAGASITLGGAAFSLRVNVTSQGLPGDTGPEDCRIFVGPKEATRGADGAYHALGTGKTTVHGTCAGVPLTPRFVHVLPNREITLTADGPGPTVVVPTATSVVLRSDEGWALPLTPAADASVQLPPLRPGKYKIAVGVPAEKTVGVWPETVPENAVHFLPVAEGFVGYLHATAPLGDVGAIAQSGP